MNKKNVAILKTAINNTCDMLTAYCRCTNLADPKDRSRFAGYEKLAGHCTYCKQRLYLEDTINNLKEK